MKNKVSDKASEEIARWRILMEQSRDGIVILDQTGQVIESVSRLAGGVAHDFNNMLGIILGRLIGEDIDLIWKPGDSLWPLKMDPSQIDQVLANLCVNARDAITGVGSLTIETGKQSFDEKFCSEHPGFISGDFVRLTISDTGCGMDKNTLDNSFEPFFTTKEVGQGTGLGLSTVYGIVKQNKGFIHVHSEPGQGTRFNIYLPRFKGENKTSLTMPGKKATSGGTETILLVEDDPAILRMTCSMLERNGYSVITGATPRHALTAMKNHAGTIDLLLTDVIMPEMNGQELAEKITAFIQKPFSMADLAEKLRGLLDGK